MRIFSRKAFDTRLAILWLNLFRRSHLFAFSHFEKNEWTDRTCYYSQYCSWTVPPFLHLGQLIQDRGIIFSRKSFKSLTNVFRPKSSTQVSHFPLWLRDQSEFWWDQCFSSTLERRKFVCCHRKITIRFSIFIPIYSFQCESKLVHHLTPYCLDLDEEIPSW